MTDSEARERIRNEAIEEARRNDEEEAAATCKFRKLLGAAVVLGVLLLLDVGLVTQFLRGHRWYDYSEPIGKYFLIAAGILTSGFMLVAGLTFGLWRYLRGIKEVHRKYAPPLSRHRTGSRTKI